MTESTDPAWVQRRGEGTSRGQERAATRPLRVLCMLRLIQEEPRTWTRARLAEHFEISERMCDKDLALLRQAGYDPRRFAGGYALGDRPDQARSVVVEQVD